METKNNNREELPNKPNNTEVKKENMGDYDKSLIEEVLKKERRDIAFEPPRDDEDEQEKKENDIKERVEKALRLQEESFAARLHEMERRQEEMARMLYQLTVRIPRFTGYLTLMEARDKFNVNEQEVYKKMNLFREVNQRHVYRRKVDGKEYYREDDLVDAMLLDFQFEKKRLAKLRR